ncbi:hypothetical protein BGZ99_000556 [Dissophora globulifera]|uniref:Uncharacterized protein n=1 Tax=Dissophora globulifera TaxID=979702 RepID=A0A9P6ULG2_9FUNG|nr:hypothetical protein BGZ99_000556 [Dissophora globulifera]
MSNAPDSVQDQRPSQSPQRLQSSTSQSSRNVTLGAAAVSSQPAPPGRSNRSSSGSIPLTQRLKHAFYHVGDRMAQLPFFRPPQPRFNGHGQGQGYGKSHIAADMSELESTYRVLPLIIGCIIPVSILINVPSVTSPWVGVRPYDPTTDSWGDPVEMPLPHWMNAMIIVALLMAVICNVCVLSRFLERHVWHSVVFGLITATLQDILSVGAIVPFCLMYPQSDKYVYLEGFWTMTASMIFSLTATFLMSIDLRRTPDFRLHGSGVTHKQRMLIAQAMALCFYLAFGALVFIWP